MQQPLRPGFRTQTGPRFYLTGRQPIRPEAVLLAVLTAAGGLCAVAFGLGHSKARHFAEDSASPARSAGGAAGAASADDKDDPSQVDTIVLGDAADAPVPARRGDRASNVHGTILVRLPRFGEQTGLIPDTPAGHLLFRWLAAFNRASYPSLGTALPNVAPGSTVAAQMDLRQQTGGFNLLSAKEVGPGVLVFRLRDQTPDGNEVLGTLHVRAGSSPAAVASFSLRAVPSAARKTTAQLSAASSREAPR